MNNEAPGRTGKDTEGDNQRGGSCPSPPSRKSLCICVPQSPQCSLEILWVAQGRPGSSFLHFLRLILFIRAAWRLFPLSLPSGASPILHSEISFKERVPVTKVSANHWADSGVTNECLLWFFPVKWEEEHQERKFFKGQEKFSGRSCFYFTLRACGKWPGNRSDFTLV